MMPGNDHYVIAIDQGTSSSRVLLFRLSDWEAVRSHQIPLKSLYPNKGWCEQDPMLMLECTKKALEEICKDMRDNGESPESVLAVGVANHRETVVVWDKVTGKPLHNAIVWFDTRTKEIVDDYAAKAPEGKDVHRKRCGLPLSTYFSAVKIRWLLDNVPEVKKSLEDDRLMMGTVDTWLIWNLTGQKAYITDVTNASRTMLMNIETLQWDQDLCEYFGIPMEALPEIRSSAEVYGNLDHDGCAFPGAPVAGCLGDQQAALVGQFCLQAGTAKITYGTGAFMLYNVGPNLVHSEHGLLTTVGYKFGPTSSPVYALEGSIASAGEAIKWLVQVGIIENPKQAGEEAKSVKDTGDLYFVPAFNGLFAPYWRTDARGTIVGITQFTNKGHICRAALEAVALQTLEIMKCMNLDSGLTMDSLLVDGGMANNDVLMQILADVLGIAVDRPHMAETTAKGAAVAAALGMKLIKVEDVGHKEDSMTVFVPSAQKDAAVEKKLYRWKEAVQKSLGWARP